MTSSMKDEAERLGRVVREVWLRHTPTRPDDRAPATAPWDACDAWTKAVDRDIGMTVREHVLAEVHRREVAKHHAGDTDDVVYHGDVEAALRTMANHKEIDRAARLHHGRLTAVRRRNEELDRAFGVLQGWVPIDSIVRLFDQITASIFADDADRAVTWPHTVSLVYETIHDARLFFERVQKWHAERERAGK